jgi:hypothetical protein
MNCRTGFCRRILLTLSLLALVLTVGGFQQALAQQLVDDNDIFELDGNPQDPNPPVGEDWHKYFGVLNPTAPYPAGNASAKTFVAETGNVSIFTQGGSKDTNGVSQWRHTDGSVPDKDDIQNAFAAAYVVNGQLIIYFGADRSANNGDANIGFWFFQNAVAPVAGGVFSGGHADGDVFVVSGFTSGGQTSEIDVYKWSCPGAQTPAACDSQGSLELITSSTAAQCASSATGSKTACAIANSGGQLSVWAYTPKSGTAGTFPVSTFFEGGINVSALFPNSNLCLSSFIAETRSSTSETAQLKDLASGSFVLCGLNVTKACPNPGVVNSGGATIHYVYNGTVSNTGAGTMDPVYLVDTLPSGSTNVVFKKGTAAVPPSVPGAATTTVSTSACPAGANAPAGAVCVNLGALAGSAVMNWSVELDSTSLSPQNNVYANSAVGTTNVNSSPAQATCTANPSNTVTITKQCGVPATYPNAVLPGTQLVTDTNLAAVQVNFSGDVCNTGQTTLTGITLTDNPAADSLTVNWPGTAGTLAAGACAKYSGNYMPTGVTAGDLGGASGRYSFSDQIKVTGATAALGTSPGHDATCISSSGSTFLDNAQACGGATCNICPAGATCGGN